jgi:hypothetical protein
MAHRSLGWCAVACVLAVGGCARAATNLISDSEFDRGSDFWSFAGRAIVVRGVGPGGSAVVYVPGDGRPCGYRNQAQTYVTVTPGKTYTFSVYVDATGHTGTPPYVFLQAADGTWPGVAIYQPGKGRLHATFTIGAASRTTLVRITFNPSNGLYPVGRGAIYSQPQLEEGPIARTYVAGTATPSHENLVIDSESKLDGQFWDFTGRLIVVPGRAPGDRTLMRIDGTGTSLGFGDSAAFLARVVPGTTYTFSCFLDGSASPRTPPYVFLQAVNGTWTGTSLWSAQRGRASVTFTIPTTSGTTTVRGVFDGENGIYARGTAAEFGEPQLEPGAAMSGYVPSSVPADLRAPRLGNLVVDSDEPWRKTWMLAGGMRTVRGAGPLGRNAVVMDGDDRPAGFGNFAAFRAGVLPGSTYTLSAYIDGSAHKGTPPYLFVVAANGRWKGASTYQSGRGRVFVTFTVPKSSGTTSLRFVLNAQNGIYPRGTRLVLAEPQLELGSTMSAYALGTGTNSTRSP